MTPEGKVEAHLKRRVKELGGEVRKVGWIGRANAPDRLVLLPAQVPAEVAYIARHVGACPRNLFIELKRPTKGATAAQAREHNRLRAAGFVVLVLNSIEAIDEVFG